MPDHKLREAGGCTIIAVAPAHTRQAFVDLLEVVRGVVARGAPRLVLNMDKLPGITSEGIGLLVLVHDECLRAGGKMVLAKVPQRVERVLKLAGVVNFFSIYADEHEGIGVMKEAVPDVQPAAAEPEAEEPEEEDVDPATALREIVSRVIRSRRHHQVIEFFATRSTKIASLDEIAGMTGIPRATAESIMQDLARGGVAVPDGELFVWGPSPAAQRKLDLFKKAQRDPRLRSRVLAWIYAEEKKVQ
jgi:anti-anti-sigma factor